MEIDVNAIPKVTSLRIVKKWERNPAGRQVIEATPDPNVMGHAASARVQPNSRMTAMNKTPDDLKTA